MPVVGDVIADRYRLDQRVELSPKGTRWVATHVGLGSVVSVKMMSDQAASDPQAVSRFRQEAVLVARIHSDHVLRVRDHGEHHGAPFIVTDHVVGHTLASRLSSGGPLGLAETADVLQQVAKALDAAHHVGMVHHDVKPSSILIGEELIEGERRVRLLDFGVDVAAGTHPSYTSPEQLRTQAAGSSDFTTLGPATDMWSLAVVVFECLTGRLPFEQEGRDALLAAIEGADPPSASAVAPELPAAIDAWFAVTLHRDPAARFGSALAMSRSFRLAIGIGEQSAREAKAPSFDDDKTFRTVRMQDEEASSPAITLDSATAITQSVGPVRLVVGSDGAATMPRAADLLDVDADMAQLPHDLAAERAAQLAQPPSPGTPGRALAASAPWAHHVPSQAGLHIAPEAAEAAVPDFTDLPTRRRSPEAAAMAAGAANEEPVSMVLPLALPTDEVATGYGGAGHAWSPGGTAPSSVPPPQAIPGALHVPAFPAPMSGRPPYPGQPAGVVALPEAWVDIAAAPAPARRGSVGLWIGALMLTLVAGGGAAYVLTDGFGRHHPALETEDDTGTDARRRRRARTDAPDGEPAADASGAGGGASPAGEPQPTEPQPTEPQPTEPQPTEPQPVVKPPPASPHQPAPPVGPSPVPATPSSAPARPVPPPPAPSAAPGSHRRSLD